MYGWQDYLDLIRRYKSNPWGRQALAWGQVPAWARTAWGGQTNPRSNWNPNGGPMWGYNQMQNQRQQDIMSGMDPYRLASGQQRNPGGSPTYGLNRVGQGQMYQQTKDMSSPDSTIGGVQNFPNLNNYAAQTAPIAQQGLSDIFQNNPWGKLGLKV